MVLIKAVLKFKKMEISGSENYLSGSFRKSTGTLHF
jgi:hypothetical protein